MASSAFKIRRLPSSDKKRSVEKESLFSVSRGPVTPQKREASQFEECRRRAQVQRRKDAFRTLAFRSEPTIGEEYLRRAVTYNAEATNPNSDVCIDKRTEDLIQDFVPDCYEHIQNFHHYRSDIAKINSEFKVIYLSNDERMGNSEIELKRVYKQYVKNSNPNSSFQAYFQRGPASSLRSRRESKAFKGISSLSEQCGFRRTGKCDERNVVSSRYLKPKVTGKVTRRSSIDSSESSSRNEQTVPMPCQEDRNDVVISSVNEVPLDKTEESAAQYMSSQPSCRSTDSDFSGLKPPVSTPTRMSRRSSLVCENEELDRRPRGNGIPIILEAPTSLGDPNYCPHRVAPFPLRFPHLKTPSVQSCHSRQQRKEAVTPSWQQYRVLCDAFGPNTSPHGALNQPPRYPSGYKKPKFATEMELEYYINVVSKSNNEKFVL